MARRHDITGMRFGRLVVLCPAKNRGKQTYWSCRCDCGTIKQISTTHLTRGNISSCGCLYTIAAATRYLKQREALFPGAVFGRLTILRLTRKRRRDSGDKALWAECKCACGKEFSCYAAGLLRGNNKSCGCLHVESAIFTGKNNKGAKCHWWKGGIHAKNSGLRRAIDNKAEYIHWRKNVFIRDDFTCQKCGNRGGELHAHHIEPFGAMLTAHGITTVEAAVSTPELWSTDNGQTLCVLCHRGIHKAKIASSNLARSTKDR